MEETVALQVLVAANAIHEAIRSLDRLGLIDIMDCNSRFFAKLQDLGCEATRVLEETKGNPNVDRRG